MSRGGAQAARCLSRSAFPLCPRPFDSARQTFSAFPPVSSHFCSVCFGGGRRVGAPLAPRGRRTAMLEDGFCSEGEASIFCVFQRTFSTAPTPLPVFKPPFELLAGVPSHPLLSGAAAYAAYARRSSSLNRSYLCVVVSAQYFQNFQTTIAKTIPQWLPPLDWSAGKERRFHRRLQTYLQGPTL